MQRIGAVSGYPSKADAEANVPVIIVEQAPQPDGLTKTLRFEVKPNQFRVSASQCATIRTIPEPDTQNAPPRSR